MPLTLPPSATAATFSLPDQLPDASTYGPGYQAIYNALLAQALVPFEPSLAVARATAHHNASLLVNARRLPKRADMYPVLPATAMDMGLSHGRMDPLYTGSGWPALPTWSDSLSSPVGGSLSGIGSMPDVAMSTACLAPTMLAAGGGGGAYQGMPMSATLAVANGPADVGDERISSATAHSGSHTSSHSGSHAAGDATGHSGAGSETADEVDDPVVAPPEDSSTAFR